METTANHINKLIFAFEYEDKLLAQRCNSSIESIFKTHISSEIQKVISKKTPKELILQIESLEVDIGYINERDLKSYLAKRISDNLDFALTNELNLLIKQSSIDSDHTKKGSDFIIVAFEYFMNNGFFPDWFNQTKSIDQLLNLMIVDNPNEVIELLKRYKRNYSKIARFSNSINSESFDSIINELTTNSFNPFINFRDELAKIFNKVGFPNMTSLDGVKLFNPIFLFYTINQSSSPKTDKSFEDQILDLVITHIKALPNDLAEIVKKEKDNNEGLTQIINPLERKASFAQPSNSELEIRQFISQINREEDDHIKSNPLFTRDSIIKLIKNERYKNIFLDQLNRKGVTRIIEKFYPKNGEELIVFLSDFIVAFKENITNSEVKKYLAKLSGISIITLLYVGYNPSDRPNYNELFLLFLSMITLNEGRLVLDKNRKQFVINQSVLDTSKINSLINNDNFYTRIDKIKSKIEDGLNLVSEDSSDFSDELTQNTNTTELIDMGHTKKSFERDVVTDHGKLQESKESFGILKDPSKRTKSIIVSYQQKVIIYYLKHGFLPESFRDLNEADIKNIFLHFVLAKDPFLEKLIRSADDTEQLSNNVSMVVTDKVSDYLTDYLAHYFGDAYRFSYQLFNQLQKETTLKNKENINWMSIKNTVIPLALILSNGRFNKALLVHLINQKLIDLLPNDYDILDEFRNSFESLRDQFTFKNVEKSLTKPVWSQSLVFSIVKRDMEKLIREIGLMGSTISIQPNYATNLTNRLTYYLLMYANEFKTVLNSQQISLISIFTILKLSLPEKNWSLFLQTLSKESRFKYTIARFEDSNNDIYTSLKNKSINLLDEFKRIEMERDGVRLKTVLHIILKDEKHFDEIYDAFAIKELKIGYNNKIKPFEAYLTALMAFVPSSLTNDIPSDFWRKHVFRFIVRLKINQSHMMISDFTSLFVSHIQEELKAIKKEDLFYTILFELAQSNNSTISTIFSDHIGIRSIEKIETLEETKSDSATEHSVAIASQNSSLIAKFRLSVLAFYAHHNFFPWWSESKSIHELLFSIAKLNQKLKHEIENIILETEEEHKFFKPLVTVLPPHLIDVFTLITSHYPKLKTKWENILLSQPKIRNEDISYLSEVPLTKEDFSYFELDIAQGFDKSLLQKAIYFLSDEQILDKWLKENSVLKAHLRSYLKLAPYMYFKAINPTKWRMLVYNFGIAYHTKHIADTQDDFEKSLIEFLEVKNNEVPWQQIFTVVYEKLKFEDASTDDIFPDILLSYIDVESKQKKSIEPILAGNSSIRLSENTTNSLDDIDSEIVINNSGLIIFWPFLSRYFEQLALLKNGEFLNNSSKNRSVYLLQHLVYNRIDFPEYDLVLNKILVGFQLEEHLSPIKAITLKEKEVTISLFNGLMANWDKVKNSSIDGLRETFFQREGKLTIKKDSFRLKVEKKGVDVLLSFIPWNISLIKLPWMTKPIYVDWI